MVEGSETKTEVLPQQVLGHSREASYAFVSKLTFLSHSGQF